MNPDYEKFERLDYLRDGNTRQRKAWEVLAVGGVFDALAPYCPVLAGTVPIGIDVDSSDLDIVCRAVDLEAFATDMERLFGCEENFRIRFSCEKKAVICQFRTGGMLIEIFGSESDPLCSAAYRHMIVEDRLLRLGGERLRRRIVELKESGIKTEPAFAAVLGLKGDPFAAMLELGHVADGELVSLITDFFNR